MVLVENHFTITRPLFDEGMKAASNYGSLVLKTVAMLGGAWAALMVFALSSGNPSMGITYFVVMALVGLWVLVIYPRSRWKRTFRDLEKQENLERTVYFYRDHFTVSSAAGDRDVDYDQVKEILETKNLFVLSCEDRVGILLSRTGFVTGSIQDVRRLMKNEWEG